MEQPSKKNNVYIILIIIIIILVATLPFHWVFYDGVKVFAKDNLTFSKTFVTVSDIDELIQRHNEATFFEQLNIRDESLHKKLMEAGIIVNEDDNINNDYDDDE